MGLEKPTRKQKPHPFREEQPRPLREEQLRPLREEQPHLQVRGAEAEGESASKNKD